jgi:hypothetical protein
MTIWLDVPARVLVLVGLTAALMVGGCARSQEDAIERRELPAVPQRAAQSAAESTAPGIETPAPASTPARPSMAPPTARGVTPVAPSEVRRPAGGWSADRYPRPEEVPLAPMGEVIGYSPVTKSPGYYPGNDPEADAVRTGRRQAPVIDFPFTGGMGSPEDLAIFILEALWKRDSRALQGVRVTLDEFSRIMWPEFPQSRPACNSTAEFAYFFLDRTCHQGIGTGLENWGGRDLRLDGIAYTVGRSPYTNFTLYDGVELHVSDVDGRTAVVRFARSFAERKGVWKVYTYKDKE